MARQRVSLWIRIKTADGRRPYVRPASKKNGWAIVDGKPERHLEDGVYHLHYSLAGKQIWEPAWSPIYVSARMAPAVSRVTPQANPAQLWLWQLYVPDPDFYSGIHPTQHCLARLRWAEHDRLPQLLSAVHLGICPPALYEAAVLENPELVRSYATLWLMRPSGSCTGSVAY